MPGERDGKEDENLPSMEVMHQLKYLEYETF